MKREFLTFCLVILSLIGVAQNVGINATGSTPNTSAGLDVDFTNKGFLVPRVVLTGINDAITITTPATSLLVYNTNAVLPEGVGYYYNSGTPVAPNWVRFTTGVSNNDWSLTGNSGTNPATNFIGTTDAQDWVIKTNNTEKMRVLSNGYVGVGLPNPLSKLHVYNQQNVVASEDVAQFGGFNMSGLYADRFNRISIYNRNGKNVWLGLEGSDPNIIRGYLGLEPLGGSKNVILTFEGTNNRVGINDSMPNAKLEVSANGGTDDLFMISSDDNTDGDLMIVKNNGNVGIGTNTPLGELYVADSASISSIIIDGATNFGSVLRLSTAGSMLWDMFSDPFNGNKLQFSAAGADRLMSFTQTGNVGIGTGLGNPQNRLDVEGGAVIGATYSGTNTAPTNGLLVEGNVGINTTAPINRLQVSGLSQSAIYATADGARFHDGSFGVNLGGSSTGSYGWIQGTNNGVGPSLIRIQNRGGNVVIGRDQYSEFRLNVGHVSGDNHRGIIVSDNLSSQAVIVPITDENPDIGLASFGYNHYASSAGQLNYNGGYNSASGTGYSGNIKFWTAPPDTGGFSLTPNVRMTINNAGNVGIGTIAPTAQLHTTGSVRFETFGAGTLVTDAAGNVSVSSDERLKDIQENYTRGLNDLENIAPISYKWRKETGYDTLNTYTGFSAQNVQKNIPEAVSTNDDGYLTLSDRPIIATLVNAVKEQQQIIEKLMLENKIMKTKIENTITETDRFKTATEARLAQLEGLLKIAQK